MLAPPEPIVLVCDDADAAAAIGDMLDARSILLEAGRATCTDELPEQLRPPRVTITGAHAAAVLARHREAHLLALGVEVHVVAPNPTTSDSAIA